MPSHVVVKVAHGIPVGYLALDKHGTHKWVAKRDTAYRFPSDSAARYVADSTDTGAYEIQFDPRTPSTVTYPNLWSKPRATAIPAPAPYVPLQPWRMTVGQRIGLTCAGMLAVLMAVSLVAGW